MATPLAGLIHTFSRLSMVQQLLLNIDFCRFWSLNIFEPSMKWAEAAQNKRCVYTVYIYNMFVMFGCDWADLWYKLDEACLSFGGFR